MSDLAASEVVQVPGGDRRTTPGERSRERRARWAVRTSVPPLRGHGAHRGVGGVPGLRRFWLKDDRVLAGMNVNVGGVAEPIKELIRART
ncbi:hypothetical protein [Sphaerimonospora thailandensis]|uniref:hypothetical protein n=1 Tax=Sphaerimonospora thailandensis TaxID=795644 RepID=UPI00194EF752|nr:hypothetical protein [Sphaerimonospora thailandensis]